MALCDRCKGRVCTKEGEDISIVEGGKRRGKRICKRAAKKVIHSTIKITANGVSVLCGEER